MTNGSPVSPGVTRTYALEEPSNPWLLVNYIDPLIPLIANWTQKEALKGKGAIDVHPFPTFSLGSKLFPWSRRHGYPWSICFYSSNHGGKQGYSPLPVSSPCIIEIRVTNAPGKPDWLSRRGCSVLSFRCFVFPRRFVKILSRSQQIEAGKNMLRDRTFSTFTLIRWIAGRLNRKRTDPSFLNFLRRGLKASLSSRITVFPLILQRFNVDGEFSLTTPPVCDPLVS